MFLSIAALFASAAFVAASPVSLEPRQITCATGLHVMAAGGCGKPCTQGDTLSLLTYLVSNVTSLIPGSDYYLVPYTGSSTEALSDSPVMVQAAQAYAAACPNTPIMFAGYSLGGIVIMNTVCGATSTPAISANLTGQVIAAITYGEETYVAGQSYDLGTCSNNAPQYARSAAGVSGCSTFAPVMRSYCNWDDPACCSGGSSSTAHFTYGDLYDTTNAAWVQQQYNSYRASQAAAAAAKRSTSTSMRTPPKTSTVTRITSATKSAGRTTRTLRASTTKSVTSTTTSSTSTSTTSSSTTTSATPTPTPSANNPPPTPPANNPSPSPPTNPYPFGSLQWLIWNLQHIFNGWNPFGN